jgi:predicted CxxxxCH...CXXCH cytochrome family protein
LLIADSDHHVFTTPDQLAKRHSDKAFAMKWGGAFVEIGDDDDSSTEYITYCHQPGTSAEQTKTMKAVNWEGSGEQKMGDTLGPCP